MLPVRQTLNPAMPVLQRPDGTVQLGWDPRRAIGIRPPAGLSAGDLAELLRGMQSGVDAESSQVLALEAGLTDVDGWTGLVGALTTAGLLQEAPEAGRRPVSVRIHGSGPLSDLLAGALNCSGTRVRTSRFGHVAVTRGVKLFCVFARGLHFALEVFRELRLEDRMRELLEQDRRQIDVRLEVNAFAFELADDAQQRQVRFGGGFTQPFQTVRPRAVVHHVRQVRVQGESDESSRVLFGHISGSAFYDAVEGTRVNLKSNKSAFRGVHFCNPLLKLKADVPPRRIR